MINTSKLKAASDRQLVSGIASGDELSLSELFRRHRDYVYRIALGTCGSREDAAEIVQDVFLVLVEQSRGLKLRGRLTTWLYRVAKNKAIDSIRRSAKRMESVEPVGGAVAPGGPDHALLSKQRLRLLQSAVTELSPRLREVFVLRIGLAMTVAETAELTNSNPGSVRTALHSATTHLKRTMDRRGARMGGDLERSRSEKHG